MAHMAVDVVIQLDRDHAARQFQRMKTRAPITLVSTIVIVGSLVLAAILFIIQPVVAIFVAVLGLLAAALWSLSAQLLAEWDRAVVLRLGHFRSIRGPGFFMIIPILDSIARVVDLRVRTTAFYSEGMLTKDTVPVNVDAIAFWSVRDTKKAILEVENYYQSIVMAVQTALRDIVGVHTLAEILSEREKIAQTLQKVLEDKMQTWGIGVSSIEMRDIAIPDNLRDALSKQAQAERERQARNILGDAEKDIAHKFAEASQAYVDSPVALQLRAMNIIYDGLQAGASLILVPSSVLDTMNLGGVAALGQVAKAAPLAPPKTP